VREINQIIQNIVLSVTIHDTASCEDGDVDLYILDPRAPEQGWLLVCFDEEWRTLCDIEWDFLDSTVACRQLGYIGGFHGEYHTVTIVIVKPPILRIFFFLLSS
jgi:hypothetical protein